MARSWFFGGLTGFAICIAAVALPSAHRGASASGAVAEAGSDVAADDTATIRAGANVGVTAARTTAPTNAKGMNGVIDFAAVQSRQNPYYRVPIGSPIPNPSKLPGHIRPYQADSKATYSDVSHNNGMAVR